MSILLDQHPDLNDSGDEITTSAAMKARTIDIGVEPAELERRRAEWTCPEPTNRRGVLGKYAKLVSSAAVGAVTG